MSKAGNLSKQQAAFKSLGEAALSLEERFIIMGEVPLSGKVEIRVQDQVVTLPDTVQLNEYPLSISVYDMRLLSLIFYNYPIIYISLL